MLPVHLTLLRADGRASTEDEARAVQDAVWAHAVPEIQLEHARARAVPDGIGLVLYVRARTPDAAQDQARRLLSDVFASTAAVVHGYSLTFQH
ncbi:hypothetical protein [Streptomyces sp. LN549]|uniref:hypothetical protein n=1 Tax=Streptomyces sp. LN549 TaxID=3112979 RepID=UPI003712E344